MFIYSNPRLVSSLLLARIAARLVEDRMFGVARLCRPFQRPRRALSSQSDRVARHRFARFLSGNLYDTDALIQVRMVGEL